LDSIFQRKKTISGNLFSKEPIHNKIVKESNQELSLRRLIWTALIEDNNGEILFMNSILKKILERRIKNVCWAL